MYAYEAIGRSDSKHIVKYWKSGMALVGLSLFIILIANGQPEKNTTVSHEADTTTSFRDNKKAANLDITPTYIGDLGFTAANVYGDLSQYGIGYPWLEGKIVLEPFRLTTLTPTIDGDEIECNEDDGTGQAEYIYTWTVESSDDHIDYKSDLTGAPAYITIEKVGNYKITLSQIETLGGEVVNTFEQDIAVKYIRREIRDLLENDRENYFSAVETMYKLDTISGQKIYGNMYKSMSDFTLEHLSLAGDLECDHLHDGLGFFTQHIAMSNEFELTIQALYPQLSLPYWDYTIEGQLITDNDNDANMAFNSVVFDDEWFGGFDDDNLQITSGRWANIKVDTEQWDNTHNSYGMLRAPWNQNPVEGISRISTLCGEVTQDYYPWPDCSVHQEYIKDFNTWYEFSFEASYDPHGPVHIAIGGATHCSAPYDIFEEKGYSSDYADMTRLSSYLSVKFLYRAGLLTCPDYCDLEEDTWAKAIQDSSCACSCPTLDEDIKNGDLENYLTHMFQSDEIFKSLIEDIDEDTLQDFVAAVCDSGIILGDQLEAASPFDPSFWPMHPTMERLFQWKVLNNYFTDWTWPTEGVAVTGAHSVDCPGHYSTDVLMWKNEDGEYFTNAELLTRLDPTNEMGQYIYDDFTWSHCEADGITMS